MIELLDKWSNKINNRLIFLAVTCLLFLTTFLLSPQQVPLVLYKLNLVTLAAVVGYWIDILLFPGIRVDMDNPYPANVHPNVMAAIVIRRALIVSLTMLGVCIAL